MLDYLLTNTAQGITYREKNSLDLNSYKKKMESLIQNFQTQKDVIIDHTNKQIIKREEETEENLKSLITLYDDRLKETRAQNAEYMKSMEDSLNQVRKQLDEFDNLKKEIFEKIKEEANLVKEENEKTQNSFLGYKKEFNVLKEKFTQLSYFIKDVRFRINLGEEVKRREFYHMSNNIDFSKIPNSEKNHNKNFNNTNHIINEFPEMNKKELKQRRGSAQFRETNNKRSFMVSPIRKDKAKNSINSNSVKKARHNTVNLGRSKKTSNVSSNQNDIIILEKLKNKNIDPFILQFTDDNEFDNKNKKNDIINLRKVSQNKKESISTNNNEKRRSTIHVGSFLMEDLKKYEQLNKSNSSSQKSISSSIDIHEKNTNIGKVVIIEENGNPQKLIEDNKNTEIIENNQNINIIKNFNNMNDSNQKQIINNNSRNNSQIIINEKSNNNKVNNNSKIIKNENISINENNIKNTKEKEEKLKKELTKEIKPSSSSKEENGIITIKNFSIQAQPKLAKTFKQISNSNFNNQSPIPKKNIIRNQSALNRNIPNIANNNAIMANSMIQKEKILRPSSSASNIYLGQNSNNKKIIIDSVNKNPALESNTFYQKKSPEESAKFYNQKLNSFNQDIKKSNNNPNKDYDIFNDYNNYKFKSHKIKNALSPNVQVIQYGVQQIFNNNIYGKNNIKIYPNKNYMNKRNNKKLLNNTENNFNKYKTISDRNNEAKELQGMIHNLQSYIKGYDINYVNGDDLREERKNIVKNSSYYKFKELINGNDYEPRKKLNSKSTKNKKNFGDFGFNI